MDNAMTNNDKAVEIAEYVADLEKRLNLWKELMVQKAQQPLAVVESAFEAKMGERYQKHPCSVQDNLEPLLQRVRSATTDSDRDSSLVSILHEGIFRKTQIPKD